MTKKPKPKPTAEQKAAADPKRSVWVSANAGSGKTHVLVDRVIRLMLDGAAPETILCLTFTKAAAAEMQNRLFQRLSEWTLATDRNLASDLNDLGISNAKAVLPQARRLFTQALETPGGLKIQTIHAFSEKLLQLFPVEAGIAPGFAVLDDRQLVEMLEVARRHVLLVAQHQPEGPIGKALATVENYVSAEKFEDLIRQVITNKRGIRRILDGNHAPEAIRNFVAKALGINSNISTADISEEIVTINEAVYRQIANDLSQVAPHKSLPVSERLNAIVNAESSAARVQAQKRLGFKADGKERRKGYFAKATIDRFPQQTQWLDAEIDRVASLIELHDLHLRAEGTASLFVLAEAILHRFEVAKREQGALDFDDLIARAQFLLRDSGNAEWVLFKLDRGITHVLVDEAQDTSPSQWAIVLAIAEEFFSGKNAEERHQRTLFVVGDRKQSIYSFQGADARAFEKVRTDVSARIMPVQGDAPAVILNKSYRSVPEILDFVDTVFPEGSHKVMGFQSDIDDDRGHTSTRTDASGIVEVWPLIVSEEPDEPDPWTAPVDLESDGAHRKRLARHIAKVIKAWVGDRVIPSLSRKVLPGDILILLQRRGPLFESLIVELRKAGVPVAGADRLELLESLSVQDLLMLGQVLLLPDDDHGLACILKSPFIPEPLSEEELFDLAHGRQSSETLWSRLASSSHPKCIADRDVLSEWQGWISRGPHALFAAVLAKFRKPMLERLGPEARDATDAFLEMALAFEQERGPSLAGFLAWFRHGETELKREMEKASGQVRLMTVHGSKGLESEIVIIPDAADARFNDRDQLVSTPDDHEFPGVPIWAMSGLVKSSLIEDWKDGEKTKALEERKRLLYVAMTRAKDELYIAGSLTSKTEKEKTGAPQNSWYKFIKDAINKTDAKVQMRSIRDFFSQEPIMRLGPNPKFDRQPKLPFDMDLFKIPAWAHRNPPAERAKRYESVTGFLARDHRSELNAEQFVHRQGQAIHRLLQDLPDVNPENRMTFALRKAKVLKLDEAIAKRLVALLDLAELQPFFGTGSQSETELFFKPEGGDTISGRIDRFAIIEDAIYLLDYKSDARIPASLDENSKYVQQLALYTEALREIYPGRAVKAALLWTQGPRLDWLSETLLTRACEHVRTVQTAAPA